MPGFPGSHKTPQTACFSRSCRIAQVRHESTGRKHSRQTQRRSNKLGRRERDTTEIFFPTRPADKVAPQGTRPIDRTTEKVQDDTQPPCVEKHQPQLPNISEGVCAQTDLQFLAGLGEGDQLASPNINPKNPGLSPVHQVKQHPVHLGPSQSSQVAKKNRTATKTFRVGLHRCPRHKTSYTHIIKDDGGGCLLEHPRQKGPTFQLYKFTRWLLKLRVRNRRTYAGIRHAGTKLRIRTWWSSGELLLKPQAMHHNSNALLRQCTQIQYILLITGTYQKNSSLSLATLPRLVSATSQHSDMQKQR